MESSPVESRLAVQEAIHRYCFAYDDRDDAALDALVDDDVVVESGAVHAGRAAALAFWRGSWETITSSRHEVSNTVVELSEDGATARSYFRTVSVVGGEVRLINGTYHDRLRPDAEGRWRFVAKRHQIDSAVPFPGGWNPEGAAWQHSTRG